MFHGERNGSGPGLKAEGRHDKGTLDGSSTTSGVPVSPS